MELEVARCGVTAEPDRRRRWGAYFKALSTSIWSFVWSDFGGREMEILGFCLCVCVYLPSGLKLTLQNQA